ncbi:acetyl-CoA carboxylase biotin carboxylase subunit [Bradyrhizobium sacchari]|uniref:biotin carboxylase n=1 Tax=Bradyrhizobium sacchari TaxID=1399419 RepID=A0A560KG43_9BRAD|nr:acetyl-CoA carboxylase biotin carboxylase subunit [Bradyrhizobium sacchari]OPY94446.1 acetyl-CoA carboxylase biotin carboxylase subunit [Bradyrhizobium sacchari]TWB64590.1 acetyl-CoA carboxylase biotin carboxylase subunit [Bradyrhizobium sacchari]TWB80914.1 acetyl-CoA carboxylase biotin carboxylase subunit [Bradyrhizobium sacchari]
MAIKSLFIANRGEIAVRINKAAKALGIRTVQAASEADLDSLACRLADEVVVIGPPQAAKSYLDVEAIVQAIKASGADAVHPGYGFLSENPRFVSAVEAAGITFVGPDAATIAKMGDKAMARAEAVAAGVPVVPGSDGRIGDLADARRQAARIGYPVMIKASAGGGGRGIRIVEDEASLEKLVPQAMAEARASFGDDGLYMERYIQHARHIEVQVLGDGTDVVHLFERECSLQRKRQKVWEEAPAAMLPRSVRDALGASAVLLARRVNYRNAGTLEYLYDSKTQEFFFIEMNTRIQVEHPITEAITGIDVVQAQLRIAGGERLWFGQGDITQTGHAIEVRINAENPAKMFMPSPGLVATYSPPEGSNIRFDTLLFEGYRIVPYYDSLVGKLIVWAPDRRAAIVTLQTALNSLKVEGIHTTVPLHKALARDNDVGEGAFHTAWLESWMAGGALEASRF